MAYSVVKLALLASTALLMSAAPRTKIDPYKSYNVYFLSKTIGPYEAKCPNVNIDFNLYSKVKLSNVRVSAYFGNSPDNYLGGYDSALFDIGSYETHSITIPFMTRDFLTSEGMAVKLKVYTSAKNFLSIEFIMYPLTPLIMDVSTHQESFVTANSQFNITYASRTMIEYFSFEDEYDYFYCDSYYRLPQTFFPFCYSKGTERLSYTSAYLTFVDTNNFFPNIPLNDNTKSVPLEIVYDSGNRYYFTFKDLMYVEPNTLMMSLEEKEGFKKTKYFYLPRNKSEELNNMQFEIVAYELGHNKSTIIIKPKLDIYRHLIGDCATSDYCVYGGLVNG